MKKLLIFISIVVLIGILLFFLTYNFNKKEPKVTDKIIPQNDIAVINAYRAKYQNFPGPSDAEVLNVAKILVSSKLTTDKIEQLLGKPTRISEITSPEGEKSPLICWGYDIGLSRSISILFDPNDNLVSIYGTGVGFDKVISPSNE